MPAPVLSNGGGGVGFGGIGGINGVIPYTHNGGHVVVVSGSFTAPTGCLINGVSAGAPIASHTMGGIELRVWVSTTALAAASFNIQVQGLGTSHGGIYVYSLTNFSGVVTAVTYSPTAAFTSPLNVTATAMLDLVFGVWMCQQLIAGTQGALGGSAGFPAFHSAATPSADGGATIPMYGLMTVYSSPQANTFNAVGAVQVNWINPTFASLAFAFKGVQITTPMALGGNLTFSGALTRQSLRKIGPAGNLSFNGALARKLSLSKALAGNLSFSGALTGAAQLLRALAGSLSFSGALQKNSTRTLSGVLSWVGSLATSSFRNRPVEGQLDFSGTLERKPFFRRQLDGFLSFAGDVGTAFTAAPRRFVVALFAQLTVVHNRLRR